MPIPLKGVRPSPFLEDVWHASRTNVAPLIAVLKETIKEIKQVHVLNALLEEFLCLTVELHMGTVDQGFHGRQNSYYKATECFSELSNLMRTTSETSNPRDKLDELITNLGLQHPQHYITGYLQSYSKDGWENWMKKFEARNSKYLLG